MSHTVEVVYTWESGRKEVRYRATEGTDRARELISDVEALKALHGKECPYSIRFARTSLPRLSRSNDMSYIESPTPVEWLTTVRNGQAWTPWQLERFDAAIAALVSTPPVVENERLKLADALLTIEVIRKMCSGEHEITDVQDDTEAMSVIAKYCEGALKRLSTSPPTSEGEG